VIAFEYGQSKRANLNPTLNPNSPKAQIPSKNSSGSLLLSVRLGLESSGNVRRQARRAKRRARVKSDFQQATALRQAAAKRFSDDWLMLR
jgi:hypothetical protein